MEVFLHIYKATKQLIQIKKIINLHHFISVHCPTRRQVPPVLKSIFIFRTLTPNINHDLQVAFLLRHNILASCAGFELISMVQGCIKHGSPSTCMGIGLVVFITAFLH